MGLPPHHPAPIWHGALPLYIYSMSQPNLVDIITDWAYPAAPLSPTFRRAVTVILHLVGTESAVRRCRREAPPSPPLGARSYHLSSRPLNQNWGDCPHLCASWGVANVGGGDERRHLLALNPSLRSLRVSQ